jgi:hypothetical protein
MDTFKYYRSNDGLLVQHCFYLPSDDGILNLEDTGGTEGFKKIKV